MTNPDDYLKQLEKSLYGLPEEKQDEILAEIESHIEEEVENGRFSSTSININKRLGAPEEMGRGITAVYSHRRHIIMLLLLPYLIIDNLPYLYNTIIAPMLSTDLSPVYFYMFAFVLLISLIFALYFGWRLRALEIGLWWASVTVSIYLLPIILSPMRVLSGMVQQVDWQNWLIVMALLGPLLWLMWMARNDGLLLVFGTLPLTLGVVIQLFQLYQTYRIGRPITALEQFMEPSMRIFMWFCVIICYFLFRVRWMRWLGMGSTIYFYLFGITYLILNLPRTVQMNYAYDPATSSWSGQLVGSYGPDILWALLIFVWVWPFVILISGLLRDRFIKSHSSHFANPHLV